MQILQVTDLSTDIQSDIQLASKAMEHSFPPNRSVRIGAVLTADGQKFAAANIRRRGFTSSTCAERMALDQALFSGVKRLDRFVIVCHSTSDIWDDFTNSPCGLCRQLMQEALENLAQTDDIEILIVNQSLTQVMKTNLGELLPLAYVKPESKVV